MQWNCHFDNIRSTLLGAEDSITIVSPFINIEALKSLLADIEVDVRILTSWRKGDFVSGLAQSKLGDCCNEHGWAMSVFLDGHSQKLHSKMYIVDDSLVWLGSANLTHSGLGLSENPNVELMTCIPTSPELIAHVDALFFRGELVDVNLIEHFRLLEVQIPQQAAIELDWEAPSRSYDIFHSLWQIMPKKPVFSDFDSSISLEEQLYLRGRRWGEFRQILRGRNIERDFIDDIIANFYEWALSKYPFELEVQTGGLGRHTECLVWKE